ncbi:MAG: LysM peptidoglycan-binding domain-containing protein [Candidatus Omnitrophica bacterium]|nr:LysM peptidoglycan-binding domain-containing protein [Candidatus Omnitrophota bacterium]
MKKSWHLSTICIISLILGGCVSIANKDDLDILKSEIDNKILTQQESNQKKFQEIYAKIEGIQKIQEQQQMIILSTSEETKNQIRELRAAIDDSYQDQKKTLETFKKFQDEKNLQFTQDIDTIRKAQNELLRTSVSLTDSMVNFQKDLLALKTSIQQIATEIDSLSTRNIVQRSDIENLKKYYDSQIETLLNEIVRQESEIVSLKRTLEKQISDEGTELASKKSEGSPTRYHIVQKGETLSDIAKKYNTSVQKIRELNKIKDGNLLIGQRLLIP